MRDIIFKGFHECSDGTEQIRLDGRVIKGKWVEGCFVYPCNICFESIGEDFLLKQDNLPIWNDYPVIPETVCEYVGLKDKNGKKIFEGDRVVGDVGNGYNRAPRLLQRIGIVEYGNKSPGFSLKIINRFGVNENGESDFCDFQGCGVSFGAFGNMEVIGTKFDDCLYKKPDGLCLRESDSENNIYCVEGPCEELFGTKFDVEVEE